MDKAQECAPARRMPGDLPHHTLPAQCRPRPRVRLRKLKQRLTQQAIVFVRNLLDEAANPGFEHLTGVLFAGDLVDGICRVGLAGDGLAEKPAGSRERIEDRLRHEPCAQIWRVEPAGDKLGKLGRVRYRRGGMDMIQNEYPDKPLGKTPVGRIAQDPVDLFVKVGDDVAGIDVVRRELGKSR